jgi:tetratricopeptide (TPR) repeat protein
MADSDVDRLPATSLPDKVTSDIPLAARIANEIKKPLDWQQFQRSCVFLYREVLKDPHIQEYGRNGQDQHGIDILGRRNGNPNHLVGIQCRREEKPLKKKKILEDCRAALALGPELKEIVFACTAENDTGASDAARSVESELRAEGHDLSVTVTGWGALCLQICEHDIAYNLFNPGASGVRGPIEPRLSSDATASLADQIAARVTEHLAQSTVVQLVADQDIRKPDKGEDADIHARIDVFRDLMKDDRELLIARRGLINLKGTFEALAQPRAEFRRLTNLGAAELNLANEGEAARLFEEAYALRPDDPKAIANLALARIIQNEPQAAFGLAQEAIRLEADPFSVGYLLQAAGKSGWQGDPESLIPDQAKNSVQADIALAEFYRIRQIEGWQAKALALAKKHPDEKQFAKVKAHAVLSLAADGSDYISGGITDVTSAELNDAATELKSDVLIQLDLADAGYPDLWKAANNAALALRLSQRLDEAQELLEKTLKARPDATQLLFLLGLIQALRGHRNDAIETLRQAPEEGEASMLLVELLADADPADALRVAQGIPSASVPERARVTLSQMKAELAIKAGDDPAFDIAVSEIQQLSPDDPSIGLLRVEKRLKEGAANADVAADLQAIATKVPDGIDVPHRVLMADLLLRFAQPLDASHLLEGRVDLMRPSPGTLIYIRALAEARRDQALQNALKSAGPAVLAHPDVVWFRAAHAWNMGDVAAALRAVEELIPLRPTSLRARVFRLEVFIRQNDAASLLDALEEPLESLPDADTKDLFRLARILSHFGFQERAAALSYKLFLSHRDESRAWMTLSSVILQSGTQQRSADWDAKVAAENTAIDLVYANGQTVFFVIEPDPDLRKLDAESWEPHHDFCLAVLGKGPGETVKLKDGEATIKAVRHKYVARFHYVLANYERRFPTIFGFRTVQVDISSPGGLDEIKDELKEWDGRLRAEAQEYISKPWTLSILAVRIGADAIDAAGSVATLGHKLKVAAGSQEERRGAFRAIKSNKASGCVIDLWTFWTAWTAKALDVLEAVAGPIHVSQHLIDQLRGKREKIALSERDGLRTIKWAGTGIALTEASPDNVRGWGQDFDNAISWLNENAKILPVVAGDKLPRALVGQLTDERGFIFDEIVLALEHDLMLVTDDMPMREIGAAFGVKRSSWLQPILMAALDRGKLDQFRYVQLVAHLIDGGQSFVCTTGIALADALALDLKVDPSKPGRLYRTLLKVLGGKGAEINSHIAAALVFLNMLWSDRRYDRVREPATGLLLESLLRERSTDYPLIFVTVAKQYEDIDGLADYLVAWAKGHFLVPSRTRMNTPTRQQRRRARR